MAGKNVVYFNQGQRRRQQVHSFFLEDISQIPNLNNEIVNIQFLIASGKTETAFKRFVAVIDIAKDITTSGYLVDENASLFGKTVVYTDLFNGIFAKTFRKLKQKKIIKEKVTFRETTLKQIEKEIEQEKREIRFGLDTLGKKKEAVVRVVVINKKTQIRLVDLKTNKYLKFTKTFKKEVQERRGKDGK